MVVSEDSVLSTILLLIRGSKARIAALCHVSAIVLSAGPRSTNMSALHRMECLLKMESSHRVCVCVEKERGGRGGRERERKRERGDTHRNQQRD